jgi:hypothetical protein
MKKTFKFRHRYHKLEHPEFTTIRGSAQHRRLMVGEVVECDTKDGKFDARITRLSHRRVGSMSDEFLAADASYPDHPVRDRADFVRLVDGFIPKHWNRPPVTLDTYMTVIYLRKL